MHESVNWRCCISEEGFTVKLFLNEVL